MARIDRSRTSTHPTRSPHTPHAPQEPQGPQGPGGGAAEPSPRRDRYADALVPGWDRPVSGRAQQVPAEIGQVIEDVETGWCGEIVLVEKAGGIHVVHLEDRRGRRRGFPLGPGFLLEGRPIVLTPPIAAALARSAAARQAAARTASGSVAVAGAKARVAIGSRIYVEGRHDAELVEKVWGDDLRAEGVVVELMNGVDDLGAIVAEFAPGPGRRLGVLVDHLVPGSKETRLVGQVRAQVAGRPGLAEHVLILGHPFVDVWQSVRPERLGWHGWPQVERSVDWKHGICAELGWPHADQADIATAWKRILGTVRSYADLEPALLGRVEELIDFVTA